MYKMCIVNTVWLRNVGHDSEVQQTTRCVRSVVLLQGHATWWWWWYSK